MAEAGGVAGEEAESAGAFSAAEQAVRRPAAVELIAARAPPYLVDAGTAP